MGFYGVAGWEGLDPESGILHLGKSYELSLRRLTQKVLAWPSHRSVFAGVWLFCGVLKENHTSPAKAPE